MRRLGDDGADPVRDRAWVMVADDHLRARKDVRRALERDGRFHVCAECVDAPEAVDAAVKQRPDICLLEKDLPGSGIAAAWEIRARLPRTRIVMITASREAADVRAALRAGASGYLLKEMDPQRLPQALDAVVCGEVAIPRALAGDLVEELRDRAPRRRRPLGDRTARRLTSREWEVLELLRRRLDTSDIARRLVVSPATVRSHIKAIRDKLGLRDREEILRAFKQKPPARR